MPLARLKSGIELFYDERGDGLPMVLVMGIGAQMILWPEGFCDTLANHGFRVIRFDPRDVGLSSRLDHLPVPPAGATLVRTLLGLPIEAPYTLEDMAQDVAELLDVLDIESAHVVGMSMGGMVAQTLAFTQPDRLRSLVSLMSTTGKLTLISEPSALRGLLKPTPRTREEAKRRYVELFRVIGSKGFARDEDEIAELGGRVFDRGTNPRGFLRHFAAIGASGDRTARLRFVRAPTLVLHGTVDPLIRPIGGAMTAEAIPNAKLRWIEGMAHDLPEPLWPLITELIARHAREAERADSARSASDALP